jgi:hypothetical protein
MVNTRIMAGFPLDEHFRAACHKGGNALQSYCGTPRRRELYAWGVAGAIHTRSTINVP